MRASASCVLTYLPGCLPALAHLALFAPAYPLAPMLALISNVFEIRIDGVKLCTRYPSPSRPASGGYWVVVHSVERSGFLCE